MSSIFGKIRHKFRSSRDDSSEVAGDAGAYPRFSNEASEHLRVACSDFQQSDFVAHGSLIPSNVVTGPFGKPQASRRTRVPVENTPLPGSLQWIADGLRLYPETCAVNIEALSTRDFQELRRYIKEQEQEQADKAIILFREAEFQNNDVSDDETTTLGKTLSEQMEQQRERVQECLRKSERISDVLDEDILPVHVTKRLAEISKLQ